MAGMSKYSGMTRNQKLRLQAKERRMESISRDTKVPSSVDAFSPEMRLDTDAEITEAWEESGVLNNVRNTLEIDNGDW
ncbi:MAG: hypothetical protein CMD98_06995 [Gammaproteobacteria bacterium]|nr:hypothetical protein [Gammaproteobacteria bacterium]|tara:strand:+ start:56116 stop:56349 length:234 start_codon:yes stop_codon:yes gene_type:complete